MSVGFWWKLVNSRTAEVVAVGNARVTFKLEDDRKLELGRTIPQLRHFDHAGVSTVPPISAPQRHSIEFR